jgi:rhodanese-related sulfurtransferase
MGTTAKKIIYEQVARMTKAFASPGRLELLDLIAQGEKTVEALSDATGLGIKNTSAQLKELRAARLVTSRKEGRNVFYRLEDQQVATLWIALRGLAESRFSEVQSLLETARSSASGLTREELLKRVKRGKALLLDVRPREEFEAGHLPNAVSIPIEELKEKISTLPRDREIIAYCRGPLCVWAGRAVKILVKKGLNASKLPVGVSEWRAAGGQVVTSGSQ